MKNFQQKNDTHSWSIGKEPWNRVHKDHAYVNGIGLLLIFEDSFSGWPKLFSVRDRKTKTIKQILEVIFSKNGVLKTLVSDNASEFCDVGLCTWLRKIGCIPYKSLPYHPQSNEIVKRMVWRVKIGLKAFEPYRDTIQTYVPKLLMSYRSIPHVRKVQSLFALMGRQIRTPITMSFSTNEKMWYKKK